MFFMLESMWINVPGSIPESLMMKRQILSGDFAPTRSRQSRGCAVPHCNMARSPEHSIGLRGKRQSRYSVDKKLEVIGQFPCGPKQRLTAFKAVERSQPPCIAPHGPDLPRTRSPKFYFR